MSITTAKSTELPYLFENGCLHIRKSNTEIQIQAWNPPTAKNRDPETGEWVDFIPDFQLVHPRRKKDREKNQSSAGQMVFDFFDATAPAAASEAKTTPSRNELRRQALDDFRAALPKDVAKALAPFRVRQWMMLQMFYYDPSSVDLALSNPALAFFLAQKLDGNIERIKGLKCGSLRQRDVLALLGYAPTRAAVKLVSKIQPASITTDNWRSIATMLTTELEKEKTPLAHISKINPGVMAIAVDPVASAAAGTKLLEAVANDHREKYRGRVVHMIKSALEMQEDLQLDRKVTFFHDLQRLYDVHERTTNRYKRRIRQLNDAELAAISGSFEDPPIPGIPGQIEPLTSPRDLVDEGECQGNCVASYAKKIATGKVYVYRVFGPQRSTLSIVKKKRGWEIGELEAKHNSAASTETEKAVNAWLRSHSKRAI